MAIKFTDYERACVAVWHGHHESDYPLEFLTETLEQRLKTISESKALTESPQQIARRVSLLKLVEGEIPHDLTIALEGLKEAWKTLKCGYVKDNIMYFRRDAWMALGSAETLFAQVQARLLPEILELHAKECGCGWTAKKPNIFNYQDNKKGTK
jgi:hypothetical protein